MIEITSAIVLYILLLCPGRNSGFNSFLSMWTQGQVQILNEGQMVQLDCEFHADVFNFFNNPVIWKKYQRQESSELNIMGNILPPFFETRRFSVQLSKNPPRYQLKLIIKNLALEDSGNYTCEVRGPKSSVMAAVTHYIFIRDDNNKDSKLSEGEGQRDGGTGFQSSGGTLGGVTLVEGQQGSLRCTSVGGYPPPYLRVLLGDRDVTGDFHLYSSATLHGTRGLRLMVYQTVRWTERLLVTSLDDQRNFRCLATVSGLPNNETSVRLTVKYGPIATCPPVYAYEGERNVHLTCELRSRPGITGLFWMIDTNGTTVMEGEVKDEYWTLVADKGDGLIETQLFMRKVVETSFRTYRLFAENNILATTTSVQLLKKEIQTPSPLAVLKLSASDPLDKERRDDSLNPIYALISHQSTSASIDLQNCREICIIPLLVYLYCAIY